MSNKERIAILDRLKQELETNARILRVTAEELRTGQIHPNHAANRLSQIANRIAPEAK